MKTVVRDEFLLLFIWNTLTVSLTVSTTIPLRQDALRDVAGLQCWGLIDSAACECGEPEQTAHVQDEWLHKAGSMVIVITVIIKHDTNLCQVSQC